MGRQALDTETHGPYTAYMVRRFTWELQVRSYEADAWGLVPTAGLLRYLEQTAVAAAADAGYGDDYHRSHGTAWVVHRMTLRTYSLPTLEATLQFSTWISQVARVRCVREYLVREASTGATICTAYTEWVHIRRDTLTPLPVPPNMAANFEVPGSPLLIYDPPALPSERGEPREFRVERTAAWHEADSLGHINNAMYVDWLADSLYSALEAVGHNLFGLREQGKYLRGEHHALRYVRAALPGDRLAITTVLQPAGDDFYLSSQTITQADGTEVLSAEAIHRWTNHRAPGIKD